MGEHADWKDLAGRQVQVRKEGRTIRTGYVKDVTVTADALWLEAYGAESRLRPVEWCRSPQLRVAPAT
ncbi:hypothetical protein DAD99_14550 [Pseudarthrobacter sp. AB1]|nr:hypothetical protein [Pseudarthrobacter sp. AB1]